MVGFGHAGFNAPVQFADMKAHRCDPWVSAFDAALDGLGRLWLDALEPRWPDVF